MKIKLTIVLGFLCLSLFAQTEEQATINWMSWEEATKLNEVEKKKIFVDIYTNWCHWCKEMDKSTFKNPEVVKIMNEHFYAVKLNAEQKESIHFNNHTFEFRASGKRGAHELAIALLDNNMGYPSFVFLDEAFQRIMLSPGFKKPPKLLKELSFAKDEAYKHTTWESYN